MKISKFVLICVFALIILAFFGCSVENPPEKAEIASQIGEIYLEETHISPENTTTEGTLAAQTPDKSVSNDNFSEEESVNSETKAVLEAPPFEGEGIVLPDDEL